MSAFTPASPLFDAYVAREENCISDTFPVWEKQYEKYAIGFVLSGYFDYSAQGGRLTGVPGTVVFGNPGEHFSVQHLDTLGNRRLVVRYDRAFIEQIADALGVPEPRFHSAALPPGKASSSLFMRMRGLASGRICSEDVACSLAAAALTIPEERRSMHAVSTRERLRILAVVGHIEHSYSGSCSIDDLAASCGLSRFRFMRVFKAVTGQSANQYVINRRLRAAAERVAETNDPVSDIAFDVGFNDISHFNACFRAMFECSPRELRKFTGTG